MRKSISRAVFISAFLTAIALLVCPLLLGGCSKSAQGGLDQVQSVYVQVLGDINDAREAGLIDARTYVEKVTPARKAFNAAIERAKASIAGGDDEGARIAIEAAKSALLELQKLRGSGKASSIGPRFPLPMAMAGVDPVSIGLLITSAMLRLLTLNRKILSGEALDEIERAELDRLTAVENARADALDRSAQDELAR